MSEFSELTHIVNKTFKWHKCRTTVFVLLVCTIALRQSCNLWKLAEYFPDAKATAHSSYRRIQRFFKEVVFDYDHIARLLMGLLKLNEVKLIFDRTHWKLGHKDINILMLVVVYHDVAIPVFWQLLDNGKGNCKTQERIALIERFERVFPDIAITHIVADGEFVGEKWFQWLADRQLGFCIPVRKNNLVKRRGAVGKVPVSRYFESLKKAHQVKHFKRRKQVCGQYLYLSGMRLADNTLLMVASNRLQGGDLLSAYRQRWQIEVLFACLKTRGFDFEATHLTDREKLKKLLAVLAVAFTWAYCVGQWCHERKPIKSKSHGRLSQSVFRLGLAKVAKAAMLILSSLSYCLPPWQSMRFFVLYCKAA